MAENTDELAVGVGNVMAGGSSSFYDLEELEREAEEMRSAEKADDELKKNLMFEEKEVSLLHIFQHLCEPIDYFFLALALIGSLGAGLAMPLMSFFSSDMMSNVGNTSEYADDPQLLIPIVRDNFNRQIRNFLIMGAAMFVANFLSVAFWGYVGNRMCYRLKKLFYSNFSPRTRMV